MAKAPLSSKGWLALSALVLVAMGGGWAWRRAHVVPAPSGSRIDVASTTTTPPAPLPPTVANDERPAVVSGRAVPAPMDPDPRPADPVRRHEGAGDLSEEIALLDKAREAMKNGAMAQALGALDHYAQRYSRHGTFALEAEALRIEALVRDGQSERARTLGRRFLALHPSSPLAERVERTLSID